jgi:hypothetical protein
MQQRVRGPATVPSHSHRHVGRTGSVKGPPLRVDNSGPGAIGCSNTEHLLRVGEPFISSLRRSPGWTTAPGPRGRDHGDSNGETRNATVRRRMRGEHCKANWPGHMHRCGGMTSTIAARVFGNRSRVGRGQALEMLGPRISVRVTEPAVGSPAARSSENDIPTPGGEGLLQKCTALEHLPPDRTRGSSRVVVTPADEANRRSEPHGRRRMVFERA